MYANMAMFNMSQITNSANEISLDSSQLGGGTVIKKEMIEEQIPDGLYIGE